MSVEGAAAAVINDVVVAIGKDVVRDAGAVVGLIVFGLPVLFCC